MRLRLRIERNLLPPVQTLWPVKDSTTTIAELLQQINGVFPLEGLTWGLEDYSISLSGYELLHYHVLKEALKDEDELVIKPLQWVDLRSRTVTGRDQITADGRHLYDGIPFGRPAVRVPTRPEVRIPPRKRRRLDEDEDFSNAGQQEEPDAPLMLTEGLNGQAEEDEDSEEDGDFQVDGIELDSDPEEDDSSSEDDSSDLSTSDSDSSSDDSSSDSSSESEDEEPWEGFTNAESPSSATKSKQTLPNGLPSPKPKQSTQKRTPSSKEASSVPVDGDTNRSTNDQADGKFVGIPSEGKAETRNRNARRRDAKKLSHLKATGVLPQNMTIADMRQLGEREGALANGNADAETQVNGADATFSAGSNHGSEVNNEYAVDEVQAPETASAASETALHKKKGKSKNTTPSIGTPKEIEQQRQQLINAIASGGVDVNGADGVQDEDEMPEQLSSRHQSGGQSKAVAMIPRSVATAASGPRAKLDLASSKRLLFSSLGVRVPKTQEEKDALQKKLAGRPKRNVAQDTQTIQTNGSPATTLAANGDGDALTEDTSDSWRNKINLTAVECCDEDVTLSEPPFPFHQRWDPQYNRRGKKRTSRLHAEGGGKKRKRGGHQSAMDETYDKYNTDGYGDALNYDDEVEDDEYWEDGALLNGDGAEDEEGDVHLDDGFPALPSDINTLPLVEESGVDVGDFIAFTELTCGADTNWMPAYKTRTAKIISLSDGSEDGLCKFQLAKRDVLPPAYDEEGNRVYSKFEMPQEEDESGGDGEDGRVRECKWGDLGDGKVRMVEKAG